MIYLNNAIYCNGIMVLPDYSNRLHFYYLPPPPQLADDPHNPGKKILKILKLKGGLTDPRDPGGMKAGLVFFDCDLRLPDEEMKALKDEVKKAMQIREEILLSPIFYKEGEVTCYVLGDKDWDWDGVPNAGQKSNIFVERLTGFGKPSLYGDNRATFSARMTSDGVTLLEKSIQGGGVIGISVVYTLKFDALRTAFQFKVTADWETIYTYLQETYKHDHFWWSSENTTLIEKLEHKKLIRFDEVLVDPAASNDLTELRTQTQQYILEKFFEPVLSVGSPAYDKVPGMVADIARAVLVVPNSCYKRVDMKQKEYKTFSFEVTRVSAVERVIYPQAHLTALIPVDDLTGYYVKEINADDDLFFKTVDVTCSVGGCDFGKQRIAWTHPYIKYGSAPQVQADDTFDTVDKKMEFKAWLQPEHGFTYRTGYEVQFEAPDEHDPETIYCQETTYSSPEKESTDSYLVINPMEDFELHTVEFELKEKFDSEKYPAVGVYVKYESDGGYAVNPDYVLKGTDESRKCRFRVRTRRDVKGRTQYRLVYHQAGGVPIEWPRDAPWATAEGSYVLVEDPFPSHKEITVRVAAQADELDWAAIKLRYRNPAVMGGYQEEPFDFYGASLADSKKWKFRTENPSQQRYEYEFYMAFKDGTNLASPGWIEAESSILVVGRRVGVERTVRVFPDGPSFHDENLQDIKISLSHTEEGDPDHHEKELVFDNETQSDTYTYKITNSADVAYDYKIRYLWKNGQVKKVAGSMPLGDLDFKVPTHVA